MAGCATVIVCLALHQHCDDAPHPTQGHRAAETGRNHEIGASQLLPVAGLSPANGRQSVGCHAGPAESALGLQETRRRDDRDHIAAPVAASFKQQWDFEHHQASALSRRPPQKRLFGGADAGMKDGFETRRRGGVAEHLPGQGRAIDGGSAGAVELTAGERRRHLGHGGTRRANETVNHGVGVEYGRPLAREHPRSDRLTHGDRARETKNHHDGGAW